MRQIEMEMEKLGMHMTFHEFFLREDLDSDLIILNKSKPR